MQACDKGHKLIKFGNLETQCPLCEALTQMSDLINEVNRLTVKVRELETQQGFDQPSE